MIIRGIVVKTTQFSSFLLWPLELSIKSRLTFLACVLENKQFGISFVMWRIFYFVPHVRTHVNNL